MSPPPGIDDATSLFAYEGEGRRLITRLKYDNHRDAVEPLVVELSAHLGVRPDLVTWIPTTSRRRRRRGFDQARLLAHTMGRHLGVECRSTLRRHGRSAASAQTGQGRRERLEASFVAVVSVSGTILLVDDVRTTGASLAAGAAALTEAGAASIRAVTLAATPVSSSRHDRRAGPLRCKGPDDPPDGSSAGTKEA